MNNILILAAAAMLILLFLKVPVYVAVLGGSAVYFMLNQGVNPIVFAQQAITVERQYILERGDEKDRGKKPYRLKLVRHNKT